MSDSREAFEAWCSKLASKHGYGYKSPELFARHYLDEKSYAHSWVDVAWITWQHQQARIDALEKELAFIKSPEYLTGRWEAASKEPQDDGSVVIKC